MITFESFETGIRYRTVCRLAAICIVAFITAACGAAEPTPTPILATLRVEVTPAGATVYVNGEERGQTPLTMRLPPGSYTVRVQHEGYATLQEMIELQPAQETLIAEALRDNSPPLIIWSQLPTSVQAGPAVTIKARAEDSQAVMHMRLWIDRQLVAEVEASALEYVWETKGETIGTHLLVIQADDSAGNTGQASHNLNIQAEATPQPSPTTTTSATSSELKAGETTLTLLAYPYEPYLRERLDSRYNFPFKSLDRAAYESANPQPRPRTFKAVVLENQYLRLSFLPELGGRLYQCIFKPTGQSIFYQNSVLKPSYWGPLSRDENWWLAAGGLEWDLPVNEHGYDWGVPWSYSIERGAGEVSIVLRDSTASERIRAEVRVTLPEGCACFIVTPRLVNHTAQPVTCQFWLNAALTLGSASASPQTEFVYPTEWMIVHSSGDPSLPAARQSISWPLYDGRDLSRYGNWRNWLGVFVPDVQADYAGAYNHDTGLGIVRTFPPQIARGLKLFAFGSGFPARAEYSDDGSEYFELWAGPCRTFWPEDDVVVGAGQSLQWSEVWLPFHGIGGLDKGSAEAAVKASVTGGQVHLGIAVSRARQVQVKLQWNGQAFYQQAARSTPDAPLLINVPPPSKTNLPGVLSVQVQDANGTTLLEYTKNIAS